jgi:zinc and cadmium transporter
MSFIAIYILLIITALASGSLIFFFRFEDQNRLKLLLAFSGAFLMGISFIKLIPEVFSGPSHFAGLFVLLGFSIQLILELITEGAEHGHRHEHSEGERVAPFLLLTGLCIHAFLEGMPIVNSVDISIRRSLVIGIVLHNIPISITLVSLFVHYCCSKRRAFLYLTIFAFMTPLGSIISSLIPYVISASMEMFYKYVLAIVVGIFLHVATSILFETSENHKYNLRKFITVCFGLGVSVLFLLL